MNAELIKQLKEIKASVVKKDLRGADWEDRQEIIGKLEEVVSLLNDFTNRGIDFDQE